MGAVLFSSGTKGRRYALPNSRFMLHQPSGGMGGTATDIALQAKEIIYMKNRLAAILSKNCNQPIEKIKEDSERDFYMSPEEAVKYGLIDKIASQPKK